MAKRMILSVFLSVALACVGVSSDAGAVRPGIEQQFLTKINEMQSLMEMKRSDCKKKKLAKQIFWGPNEITDGSDTMIYEMDDIRIMFESKRKTRKGKGGVVRFEKSSNGEEHKNDQICHVSIMDPAFINHLTTEQVMNVLGPEGAVIYAPGQMMYDNAQYHLLFSFDEENKMISCEVLPLSPMQS